MGSAVRGYIALRSALMDWKWWERAPGVVEAMALSGEQIRAVDAAMKAQALDAIEHWQEETGDDDTFADLMKLRSWGFHEFYAVVMKIARPEGASFHTPTWSSKEGVLQQIEDLLSDYGTLWEEISALPLNRIPPERTDAAMDKVSLMREFIFDALAYVEWHREEVEPRARPK